MKNRNVARLMAWALVVALPLWVGSCKKGGDAVAPTRSNIEGSWRITGEKIDPAVDLTGTGKKSNDLFDIYRSSPNGSDILTCLTTTIITFNGDGRITGKAGSKCTSATNMNPVDDNSTWKVDGSKLTITSGTDVTTYDVVISGNTLTMSNQVLEDLDFDGKKETYTTTLELTKA